MESGGRRAEGDGAVVGALSTHHATLMAMLLTVYRMMGPARAHRVFRKRFLLRRALSPPAAARRLLLKRSYRGDGVTRD